MPRLKSLFPWLLLTLPFLLLIAWLRDYAFMSFLWDDWNLINERFPTPDMKPSWEGIFLPYAGHSIPWLKLSTIMAVFVGQGDPRAVLVLTLLLAIGSALLLARLMRTTGAESSRLQYLVIGLAVASPVFAQAWQWWICWVNFFPFFCVLCVANILYGKTFSWRRFSLGLIISYIAAQAHGSGGLVWLALLPSFLQHLGDAPKRIRIAAWVIYGLAGAIIFRPYLAGAMDVGEKSELALGAQLLKLTQYGLTLLGGSLAQGLTGASLLVVQLFGLAFCLGAALLAWLGWWSAAIRPEVKIKLSPWLSVALFGLLAGGSVAAGRSWLPVYQALTGRYILLTYPLWLGLYFAIKVLASTDDGKLFGWRWPRLSITTSVTTLILLSNVWFVGYASLRQNYLEFLSGVAPLNFCRLFPENPALKRVYMDVPVLFRVVDKLESNHVLSGYTLYDNAKLATLGHPNHLTPIMGGHLTEASTDASGQLLIEGYGYLYEADRPVDLVLLTWESAAQPEPTIFSLVSMPPRHDFYQSFGRLRRPEHYTAWKVRLTPQQLPEPNGVIRAWAFDQEKRRIYRLRNAVTITDRKVSAREALAKSPGAIALDERWPEPVPPSAEK